jgi:DNA-binding SARP family transcriptional activator
MADLQIRLLGQFQVSLGGKVVSSFVSDKARALLTYLVVEGQHPHRRETLAGMLWPDKPDSRARANLRNALANLRQIIGDSQANPPYLLITHQDIKFNLSSHVWVDVEILFRIHGLEKATPENINLFNDVLDLYKGEFLAGFNLPDSLHFDEWALLKREQCARKMIAILQQASNYFEDQQLYEIALPFAWRHVELEPWQEKARRQLMRLLLHSGRRDEALQQYHDLKSSLRSDLNINPGAKTRQLYQNILEGKEETRPNIAKMVEDAPATFPEFLLDKEVSEALPSETFVARQQELERLHAQLDTMMEGQGNILLVAGEAGSGKTMLVREFVRQAQTRYPELVSAAGYSNAFTGVGDPYLPFREILYQLSGDILAHWKAGSFSRQYALNLWNTIPITCQSLLTYGPDLIDTIIPGQTLLELAASYSKAQPAWYTDLKEYWQNKQQRYVGGVQQVNLFSQITAVLYQIANQVPLLLFLDDLQWADTGTIGMLFHISKQIPGSRILLIGAYRSEEVSHTQDNSRHPLIPILHEIQRSCGDVIISLDASLDRSFVEELIASEPNALDDAFCEQLFSLTGGHALFTVELLRNMQESGALGRDRSGVWVMQSDFQLETLPPKTEGIIVQRISRLPQNLQRILTLAAIEGEIFTAEIIAAVEGLPVSQVVSLLSDQLDKQHRLVRPLQISWQDDQSISTYRFRHFLFQEFMYTRLDDIHRSRLHNQVGGEMEKIVGEYKTKYAVYLARHFHQANQAKKALTYYSLAGERAVGMSAYPEAINHFEAAIKMLLSLPEDSARNEKELGLQLQLGVACQAVMGFANEKVGQAYQRAWELSPKVDEPIKVTTTLHLLLSYYANMAEFDTGYEILALLDRRYKELGEEFSDYIRLLDWGYGYLDYLLGRIESAHENFERVVANYDQEKYHSFSGRVGMEAGIYCHGWAGLHAVWLGYPDQAKQHISDALEIAEGHDLKLFTNDALWLSTWISLEMEDIAAAREYSDALLELTTQEHYFFYEAVARAFKGRILSRNGKHQEAIASVQQGLDMFYLTGMVTTQTFFLHALAEAYCAAGRVEDGLDVILKTEQIEQETGEIHQKASLQRIKGNLYLLAENETAAEESYLAAVATAQEQSAKLLELLAAKRLASLWNQQGKREQSREILQEVYDWFTEGFDTPILIEARDLLEELVS